MPIYSMKNTETGDVFEVTLKMSERQPYLDANPHLEQVFTKFPGIGDPMRLGVTKVSDGFADILKHAKKNHLHSTINTRR